MSAPNLTSSVSQLRVALSRLDAAWRRDLGISAYEMHALTHLEAGPLTIGQLGERVALTSGAMTGLVDRLGRGGFVQRVADPGDGRRVLLHLTVEAKRRMRPVRRPFDEALAEIERSIPADLASAFTVLVARITQATTEQVDG